MRERWKETHGSVKKKKKKKETVFKKKKGKRCSRAGSLSRKPMATMVHTNLKRRTSTSKFLPSNRMRKKTFRFPLDLTRRVFPENFTNRKRSSTASSCFPTNRSSAAAAAARTRDNTMTKEATISKKRTMTRRMKKRPQENRRCYGFAKAFLSERILNTRTGGSVAVILLRPDSQ